MIEVKITDNMKDLANLKAKDMGLINNSILSSRGNFAGFLGEQVVLSVVGGEWSNTYDYDLISKKGNKIDVKTKQTTVKPRMYYEASVPFCNPKKVNDEFVDDNDECGEIKNVNTPEGSLECTNNQNCELVEINTEVHNSYEPPIFCDLVSPPNIASQETCSINNCNYH